MIARLGLANNYYVISGGSLFFFECHFPQTLIVKWPSSDADNARVVCVGLTFQ